jgi:predicted ATPase
MIQTLSIRNFKSIRALDIDCRRVNVFIGEPNAGKTNVLEALGLWCPGVHSNLQRVCRTEYVSELFFDQNVKDVACVFLDKDEAKLFKTDEGAVLRFPDPSTWPEDEVHIGRVRIKDNLDVEPRPSRYWVEGPTVKYFIYHANAPVDELANGGLSPPFGSNLASLLANDKTARQIAADYYFDSRYRLTVDVGKRQLSMSRQEDSAVVSFPYSATSETLRRMIFYRLALETSRKCVLAFDEPEANSYPPYTKILAESIAKDEQENQFFLTTHSPYMLTSIIAKTPPSELNVFVCRLEGSETKVYPMNEDQRMELMEMDMSAFFNLDRFLPDQP